MWKRLSHPHIVPFVGVTLEPLQLVSMWMPGGELRDYVKENPYANLIRLVSHLLSPLDTALPSCQLLGVAEGLAYLHSCNVIHGDLKGVCIFAHHDMSLLRNPNQAEHNGRRIQQRTNHRLRSRCHHPRPTLNEKQPR